MSGLGEVAVKAEAGDHQHQSMELEVYQGEKKPEELAWMPHGDKRIYYHVMDEDARTTDPVKMQQNFRIPVAYLVNRGKSLGIASHVDPRDEFVVSPAQILALLPDRAKDIECAKLYFAKKQAGLTPLRTIQRKEIFCKRIRRVIKSKNKVHALQKYWEKFQRRKLKREERQKLRAIKKEEEATREAANKTAVCGPTTVVAKADWFHMVTLQSVGSLGYCKYINDEILDYGMALAMKRHRNTEDAVSADVHGWTAYFSEPKERMPVKSLRFYRQLKKRIPNLLALKYMIIPAVRENHWFMTVICQPFPDEADVLELEKKVGGGQNLKPCSKMLYNKWLKGKRRPHILVFDSLAYRPCNKSTTLGELTGYHRDTANRIINGLFALHRQLWKQTGRAIEIEETTEEYFVSQIPYHIMKAPGQTNTYDCGLFVITYVMMWFNELKKVNDDYMTIYGNNFASVFPFRGLENLRHTLYKTIEDWCADNPELRKLVELNAVPPYFSAKVESGEENDQQPIV